MKTSKFTKRKTYALNLTKYELLHLRDLFSVAMPPDLKETLSQKLATKQERVMVESKLWLKISNVCKTASIPLDDNAPDFVIAPTTTPSLDVFELAQDPGLSEEENEGQESLFDKLSEEDE